MKRRASYEIDMLNGPVLMPLIRFALPLMLSGILQLAFNAADVIVVGRFAGDKALAAVGSNGSLVNLIVNLFMGLAVGTNVMAARCYGAQDHQGMQKTVHTSMALSLIGGVVLTIVGVVFAPTFLGWMGVPEDIIGLSSVYLRIYFCGMIATMFYNFGAAILRSVGDTKRPLMYLSIAGVVNVVLNLIFVVCFHMSVAGVALATIISQFISAGLVVICLMRSEGAINFDIRKMRIHADVLKGIVRVGLPASIQSSMFSIANVAIQSAINSFGSVVVAANSAAANLEGFVYVAMNSLYQAVTSFTSQNYGAKKYERIWKIFGNSLALVSVVGIVMGLSMWAAGDILLRLYTDSPEVIAEGQLRLTWMCIPYVFCGIMDLLVGGLRGIGYSLAPMIVSVFGACVFRLFWVYVMCDIPVFSNTSGVYIAYPISWVLTAVAQFAIFIWGMRRLHRDNGLS